MNWIPSSWKLWRSWQRSPPASPSCSALPKHPTKLLGGVFLCCSLPLFWWRGFWSHTQQGGKFISNFYTLLTDIGRSLSAVWGSITLDKLHEVVAYLIILFLLPNFPLVQQLLAKAVKIG